MTFNEWIDNTPEGRATYTRLHAGETSATFRSVWEAATRETAERCAQIAEEQRGLNDEISTAIRTAFEFVKKPLPAPEK